RRRTQRTVANPHAPSASAPSAAAGRASTHGPSRPFEVTANAEAFEGPLSVGPRTVAVLPGGAKVATGYQVVIFQAPPIFWASARNDQAPWVFSRGCSRRSKPPSPGYE